MDHQIDLLVFLQFILILLPYHLGNRFDTGIDPVISFAEKDIQFIQFVLRVVFGI